MNSEYKKKQKHRRITIYVDQILYITEANSNEFHTYEYISLSSV